MFPDYVAADSTLNEIDPEDTAEAELIRRAANLVQGDYDEKTWQAFWRVTVDGHSSTEVANDLEMTPNAVRQAKFRVLHRLREMLG